MTSAEQQRQPLPVVWSPEVRPFGAALDRPALPSPSLSAAGPVLSLSLRGDGVWRVQRRRLRRWARRSSWSPAVRGALVAAARALWAAGLSDREVVASLRASGALPRRSTGPAELRRRVEAWERREATGGGVDRRSSARRRANLQRVQRRVVAWKARGVEYRCRWCGAVWYPVWCRPGRRLPPRPQRCARCVRVRWDASPTTPC